MHDPVALQGARVLVTGATGQVAFPLIQSLAPSSTVYALARFGKAEDRARIEATGAIPVAVDLAAEDLSAIPDDIDYVVHMAVVKSGDFAHDMKANAEGAGRLMSRCRRAKAFLHFSSTAVYAYGGHEPRREDAPLGDNHRAMFPTYSLSKIAAESVVRFAARELGLPATIARLSVPYGNNGGWPWFHVQMMKAGMPIDVHPDWPNTYNPIHQDDIMAKIPYLLAAATSETCTLNFGGESVSIEDWCAYLGELTGLSPVFRDNPKAFGSLQIDPAAMQAAIGTTQVDWKAGMKRMLEQLAPDLLKC
ncbi:MAG TPA: NAD(P)-dependent oxidoreductase [Pseudomonadales bacterium]